MSATDTMSAPQSQQPITILLCALGGEGGGVLTQWLVDVARLAGYAAQATSIPGVAQRTGATTYYLEVFPVPLSQLHGKRPVFGLNPLPGKLDLLASSELLETTRQISHGLSASDRTLVISSTSRALTTLEKMHLGDGRQDDQALLQTIRSQSHQQHLFDMASTARDCGTVVSAVLLGAIAACGVLPFVRQDYEAVIGQSGGSAKASLRGFAAAWDAVSPANPAASDTPADQKLLPNQERLVGAAQGLSASLSLKDADARSAPDAAMTTLGRQRVQDYQGTAYATLYQERVDALGAAERSADPTQSRRGALTQEAGRWLALWMCYDDVIRVADLKSRAARAKRVRDEVKARDADLVKVYDHFKPGVPEFAALLPKGLGRRLEAWDARRVAQGHPAWNLPLKVGSHSVLGMFALRGVAAMRFMRPHSVRYAQEQALIDRWLTAVREGTRRDWQLGMELAQCGRLIKGYGSTNERAKRNLLHIIDTLARPDRYAGTEGLEHSIAAISAARAAALQDEAGKALDQALVRHGAAARPIQAVPIRWVKQPPGAKRQTT